MNIPKYDRIVEKLIQELDHARFVHTIGVAFTSASLAMKYEYDPDRALLAGLLHDCAKCFPTEEKLRLCEEGNVELTDIELRNPSLIHAKLGAYIAERDYDVHDSEILDAIRTHTTGAPGMKLLQKIVFVADLIEPNRDDEIPEIEITRQMAFENIDRCIFRISKRQLEYLKTNTSKEIDPMTLKTYEFYKEIFDGR